MKSLRFTVARKAFILKQIVADLTLDREML